MLHVPMIIRASLWERKWLHVASFNPLLCPTVYHFVVRLDIEVNEHFCTKLRDNENIKAKLHNYTST